MRSNLKFASYIPIVIILCFHIMFDKKSDYKNTLLLEYYNLCTFLM